MPYYGFNFQWMTSWQPGRRPDPADLNALDFLAETGFNFVRLPVDYRFWTRDFDYLHPDARVFEHIDGYLEACRARGLHLLLNLHRAPGYCINRNDLEKHNLWLDAEAQDAFVFLWETFARRYQGISRADLSFDLVNEPPEIGQYGMTRDNHAGIMRRTSAAIRAIDSARPITVDGLAGGNLAMPELVDLGATHSGRGYQPMPVSHYQASWWAGSVGLPEPVYPGTDWQGKRWNRDALRDFYQPWRAVEGQGMPVHIGECGCYDSSPNDIAMRWFADLFGVFKEFRWGFSLWNFVGSFGIIGHHRSGTQFEMLHGYVVDRALFDLMLANRV